MNDAEKEIIIGVLASQALADHLGDVRDAELKLWNLLGIRELDYGDGDFSAYRIFKNTIERNGYKIPEHLRED